MDGITDSMDMSLSKLWNIVKDSEAWHAAFMGLQRVRHNLVTEQQQREKLKETKRKKGQCSESHTSRSSRQLEAGKPEFPGLDSGSLGFGGLQWPQVTQRDTYLQYVEGNTYNPFYLGQLSCPCFH